jgi:cytochrome c oxidase subunit 2
MNRKSPRGTWLLVALLAAGMASVCPPAFAQEGGEAEAAAEEAPVKRIQMIAENWKFIPNEILVRKGTRVVLEIQSYDSPHSFVMKAYRIKVPLPEKKTTTIEFIADKVGKFRWRCGRPCGDGCAKMTGKLVVTE